MEGSAPDQAAESIPEDGQRITADGSEAEMKKQPTAMSVEAWRDYQVLRLPRLVPRVGSRLAFSQQGGETRLLEVPVVGKRLG